MKYLFLFLFYFFLISCGSNILQKNPGELKQELKTLEQSRPNDYLSITEGTTMTHNLIHKAGLFHDAKYDGFLISGIIKNSATIAKFKDICLTVKLFSKTGTLIENDNFTIYEFFNPNSSKPFTIKIYPPVAMNSYNVTIKSAIPSD